MKIAILGAMREEIEPILEHFEGFCEEKYARNSFYTAKYAGHDIVLAYSKIGKVASAMSATILFERYGADILLFTGVAGALDESLKIGDIIIASKCVQHDAELEAFGHPLGFIPESDHYTLTDPVLNSLAKKVAAELDLELLEGIIASGDQFIAGNEKKMWIKQQFAAAACEMEGASVGQVCAFYAKPFFLLRAISDTASGDAGVLFDEFLKSSAKIGAQFLIKMIEKI